MKSWLKIVVLLAVIWAVAGVVIWIVRAAKPTPASVAAFMQPDRLEGKSPAERAKLIDKAAGMLNQLDFDQRGQLRHDRAQDKFFRALTPDEQGRFLDATLPGGFKQMMESFNKMEPQKRRKFVENALKRMQEHEGDAPPPNLDDKNVQRIVDQGLKSFYNDANADTKLDLAPLIEQMQKSGFAR
jgi:hypothetical protein